MSDFNLKIPQSGGSYGPQYSGTTPDSSTSSPGTKNLGGASANGLQGLTQFLFNGQPPPSVDSYASTTTGVPDWLAQGEINLLNTSAGVAQGLSNQGYPLAGLPQIGAFNKNFPLAQNMTDQASQHFSGSLYDAGTLAQGIMGGAGNPLDAAQGYFDQANQGYNAGLGANSLGVVQPYANNASSLAQSAGSQNYLPLAQSYINQGVASNPLQAASPLVNRAASPLSSTINDLMQNSYIPQENNALMNQAQTNLQNFLLPQTNEQFIGAGQAGSSRNQNYDALTTAYALQNLQSQQAQNLQQGYQSAANTALGQQSNLSGLAGTVGGLGAAQQQALIGAGNNLANIGYQGANTQLGAASQLGNLGALLGGTNTADIGQKLQAAQGLTAQGLGAGQLQNQEVQNQMQAANQLAQYANQYQQQMLTGAQAQDVLGQEQQNYGTQAVQANNANILNQANWTPSQLSWLSNILHGLPSAGSTSNTTIQQPLPPSYQGVSPAAAISGLGTLGNIR